MTTLVNNRKLKYGDLVRVYFNFNKKVFSIQKKIDGRWLVVAYSKTFMLSDATFKVSEKGRQRVLDRKIKNVHAFIYGKFVDSGMGIHCNSNSKLPVIIKYNPYKYGFFYSDNLTIHTYEMVEAGCVKFTDGLVTASYTVSKKVY